MTTLFTKDYFENGQATGLSCYSNYRWLPDLTVPMAKSLVRELGIKKGDSILDFGCAKGFVVKALFMLGHNAHGIDVSEYAVAHADPMIADRIKLVNAGEFIPLYRGAAWDWVLCKDVLEHLDENKLHDTLAGFSFTTKKLFVAVPLGDGDKYVIPAMEDDVTHQIRRPLDWWKQELLDAGFSKVRASYAMPGVKENWAAWPEGNGFLVAE
jgi:SAM-dependent methyltransferase